ncbi:hypothetical protein [Terriglobus albidus]|uniref:hypothetical protein n=1 Tax=Terriglobus albidus TaxID=1592106 RepID=UPI0021E05943|nr:hypothetical protein [Terriglobus albidus]
MDDVIVDRRLPCEVSRVTLKEILDAAIADGELTAEEVRQKYADLVEDRMVRMGTRV